MNKFWKGDRDGRQDSVLILPEISMPQVTMVMRMELCQDVCVCVCVFAEKFRSEAGRKKCVFVCWGILRILVVKS